jgi:hypothetical protein
MFPRLDGQTVPIRKSFFLLTLHIPERTVDVLEGELHAAL